MKLKLFLLALIINFAFAKKKFKEPDTKDFEKKVNCKPKPKGDVYNIISYTVISEERDNVQFGIVRSIIYGGKKPLKLDCPKIKFDDKAAKKMKSRNEILKSDCFPVKVCEFEINEKQRKLQVITEDGNKFSVPHLSKKNKKIGILGDSGCRNTKEQKCNDKIAWPFRHIIEKSLEEKIKIMIHLGDLRYSNVKCDDISCSDNFQNWLIEFFQPTLPLLKKVPFLFVRGNHEDCNSKGDAYFLFFHHLLLKETPTCDEPNPDDFNYLDPWKISIEKFNFYILDSSYADDYPSIDKEKYKKSMKFLRDKNLKKKNNAIITHRAIFGSKGSKSKELLNWTLQDVFKKNEDILQKFEFILSGHIHTHQIIRFSKKNFPPQIITGNSGVSLKNKFKLPENQIVTFKNGQIGHVTIEKSFGFDVWSRNENSRFGWKFYSHFLKLKNDKPKWKVVEHKFDE
eukprot:gene6330-10337_t